MHLLSLIILVLIAIPLINCTSLRRWEDILETGEVLVTGQTVCGRSAMAGARVELWMFSNGFFGKSHARINETIGDGEGKFSMGGKVEEGDVDGLYLRVTHTCEVKKGCTRQSDYYISTHGVGKQATHIGLLNLALRGSADTQNCPDD